eukprot:1455198-Prymnesium_polylepis.1
MPTMPSNNLPPKAQGCMLVPAPHCYEPALAIQLAAVYGILLERERRPTQQREPVAALKLELVIAHVHYYDDVGVAVVGKLLEAQDLRCAE